VKFTPELMEIFTAVPTPSALPAGLKVAKRFFVVSPAASVLPTKSKVALTKTKESTLTESGASVPPSAKTPAPTGFGINGLAAAPIPI